MIVKIYYNTTTGEIDAMTTMPDYAYDAHAVDKPHIIGTSKINIRNFKVNLDTLLLEEIPIEERPVPPKRR